MNRSTQELHDKTTALERALGLAIMASDGSAEDVIAVRHLAAYLQEIETQYRASRALDSMPDGTYISTALLGEKKP